MLYHLFSYLDAAYDLPGAGLFKFVTFRAAMSLLTSLFIGISFGKTIIEWLQLKQVGEIVRDLGLQGQIEKRGTPTMGGIIILTAILVPTLLFADLTNVYTHMMIIAILWLGSIGFIDDYIKVYKKNKDGLAGKFKIVGQIGVGIIIGAIMMWHPDVVIKELGENGVWNEIRSTVTTIPFVKGNSFDYAWLIDWAFNDVTVWVWIVFIPIVILIVTAVSNGANLTDGLDGLATG
ncbi:MAG: phospho-N-acetylmuramoyl-pentapeptide-transferase, partial [Flavobacteriales bacterium]|nr:phospho-N-acetylmuramoyl-pentapeptide-transferase [Flavobacteriales bacterium]